METTIGTFEIIVLQSLILDGFVYRDDETIREMWERVKAIRYAIVQQQNKH